MIRFLKCHVWPWAEIERLRADRERLASDVEHYFSHGSQAMSEPTKWNAASPNTSARATRTGGSPVMADALATSLIWALFLIVIPPVSAACWLVVWWHEA